MIPAWVLIEELLQQTATKLATTLNDSVPLSDEYQHKFSDEFEEKMRSLINGISTKCCAIANSEFYYP